MKPDCTEKELRNLFNELKCEDQIKAPAFVRTWAAAGRRSTHLTGPRRLGFAVPMGVAGAGLLAVIALVFWRTANQPNELMLNTKPEAAAPSVVLKPTELEAGPPQLGKVRTSSNRPRRSGTVSAELQAAIAISAWRSPTESLLRSPGEEILRSLPRLNESEQLLKSILNNDP